MKYIIIIILIVAGGIYFYQHKDSSQITPITDLPTAIEKANNENKNLFVLYGRPTCSNCNSLRTYIDAKEVVLPKESFVFADIDCDEKESSDSFYEYFQVNASLLPIVVIADQYGRQFATRSGYGSPEEFNRLIEETIAQINRDY